MGDRTAASRLRSKPFAPITITSLPNAPERRETGMILSQFPPTRANIRFMFHAMVTRLHSPRTLSRPRRRNWQNPSTDLMDSKYWLGGLLAQDVALLARFGLQPMAHRCQCRWMLRCGRSVRETFGQREVVRLPSHRNHRFDPGGAGVHVGLAEMVLPHFACCRGIKRRGGLGRGGV